MRLFLGRAPAARGGRCPGRRLRPAPDPGRKGSFSRRENYHLTLAFLGETPPSALRFSGGLWGRPGGPGAVSPDPGRRGPFCRPGWDTWWSAAPSPLWRTAAGLDARSARGGLCPPGREFCPHLTLARRVCAPGFAPAQLTVEPVSFRVERLCLMESLRIRQILTYRELFSVSLARPV